MMKTTNYTGIDYGLGRTNINKETGIRFGVIAQNSVNPDAWADADADYGKPHCPDCGGDVKDSAECSDDEGDGKDFYCPNCHKSFWSDVCFPDEPLGYSYDHDGYKLTDCLDSDIMVLLSPYFTYAQFCSPCVPGACSLENPLETPVDANKCYCLGHDWFDGGAPYPVYSVATGEVVPPENQS